MVPPDRPPLPPGRHVDLPGRGTTFVRETGPSDAPAVFLLHGWTVTADLNWFPTYQHLAERYRVVALDHRGHGRGIRPRGPFRLADCADDAAALADVLGIDTFVPVGYSMGGPVALLSWHRHRERVRGLVVCATFGRIAVTPRGRRRLRVLAGAGRGLRYVPRNLRQAAFQRMLDSQTRDRVMGPWAMGEIRAADPRLLLDAGGAIGRFDATAWLPEIDVPSSVVITTRDEVVSVSRQRELAAGIGHARTWELEARHDVCVMRPDVFLPALSDAVDHAVEGRTPVRGCVGSERTEP